MKAILTEANWYFILKVVCSIVQVRSSGKPSRPPVSEGIGGRLTGISASEDKLTSGMFTNRFTCAVMSVCVCSLKHVFFFFFFFFEPRPGLYAEIGGSQLQATSGGALEDTV